MNLQRYPRLLRLLCLAAFLLLAALPLRAQFYSVQTNLAKLATTSFYLEGSMSLNLNWSAHLGLEYNPWTFAHNRKIKNFSVTPGVRYWMNQTYIGHFVSANALYSRYNFTWRGYRYDGNGGGLGATYGYAFLLGIHWNLELEAGAGFLWGRHRKYDCEKCGTRYGKESKVFLTPKLGVNIAYLF